MALSGWQHIQKMGEKRAEAICFCWRFDGMRRSSDALHNPHATMLRSPTDRHQPPNRFCIFRRWREPNAFFVLISFCDASVYSAHPRFTVIFFSSRVSCGLCAAALLLFQLNAVIEHQWACEITQSFVKTLFGCTVRGMEWEGLRDFFFRGI